MKLEARMSKLEAVIATHLEESGTIRTDLAWLKRSFWALATAGMTFNVGLAVYIIQRAISR